MLGSLIPSWTSKVWTLRSWNLFVSKLHFKRLNSTSLVRAHLGVKGTNYSMGWLQVSASHIRRLNPGVKVKAPADHRGKRVCFVASAICRVEPGCSVNACSILPFSNMSKTEDDLRKCDSSQSRPEFSTFHITLPHQTLGLKLGLMSMETQSLLF